MKNISTSLKLMIFTGLLISAQKTLCSVPENHVYNTTNDKGLILEFYTEGIMINEVPIIAFATVPQMVNMHQAMASKMKIKSKKKIKASNKVNVPKLTELNDYQISVQNNKFVITKLDTILGISIN